MRNLTEAINEKISDFPDFNPDYTPKQMVDLGIFGGSYFSGNVGKMQENVPSEFLQGMGKNIIQNKLIGEKHDKNKNKYGVSCGSTYSYWKKKGWIKKQDPFGWFNWYINFYYGRRTNDDQRQIGRWKSFKGRHSGILKNNCSPKSDKGCEKTRQNLLHWAIDSKKI